MHLPRRGNGHALRACSLSSPSSLRPRTINPSTMRSRRTRIGRRRRCRCLRYSRARRRWLRSRLSLGVPNLFLRLLPCTNPSRHQHSSIQTRRRHRNRHRCRPRQHSTLALALRRRSRKPHRLRHHLGPRLARSPLRQRRRSSTGSKCLKPTRSLSRSRTPSTPFPPPPQAAQPRSRSATPGRPRALCRASRRTRTSRRP